MTTHPVTSAPNEPLVVPALEAPRSGSSAPTSAVPCSSPVTPATRSDAGSGTAASTAIRR